MSYRQVPLTNAPRQSLTCSFTFGDINRSLDLLVHFSEIAGYWLLDITDADTGIRLVSSLPLVPSDYPSSNILRPYSYLGIGSAYVINTSGIVGEYPTADNLGTDWQLIWGDST